MMKADCRDVWDRKIFEMKMRLTLVLLLFCSFSLGCTRFIKPTWDAPIFEGEVSSNDSCEAYDVSLGVEKFWSMKGTRACLYMAYRNQIQWRYLRLLSVPALREDRFSKNVSDLEAEVVVSPGNIDFSFNGTAYTDSLDERKIPGYVKGRVTVSIHLNTGRAEVAHIRFEPFVGNPHLAVKDSYEWFEIRGMKSNDSPGARH